MAARGLTPISPPDDYDHAAGATVGSQPNDVTDRAPDSAIVMIFNVSGR